MLHNLFLSLRPSIYSQCIIRPSTRILSVTLDLFYLSTTCSEMNGSENRQLYIHSTGTTMELTEQRNIVRLNGFKINCN